MPPSLAKGGPTHGGDVEARDGDQTRQLDAAYLAEIRSAPPAPPTVPVSPDILVARMLAARHSPRRLARVLACADVTPSFRRRIEGAAREACRHGIEPVTRVQARRPRVRARRQRCARRTGAASASASDPPGGGEDEPAGEHARAAGEGSEGKRARRRTDRHHADRASARTPWCPPLPSHTRDRRRSTP